MHDLASTCVGNETYLSASYCDTDEKMFETDANENLYSGTSSVGSFWCLTAAYATSSARKRLAKTRNLEERKRSPDSYGCVMIRSCISPHSR